MYLCTLFASSANWNFVPTTLFHPWGGVDYSTSTCHASSIYPSYFTLVTQLSTKAGAYNGRKRLEYDNNVEGNSPSNVNIVNVHNTLLENIDTWDSFDQFGNFVCIVWI